MGATQYFADGYFDDIRLSTVARDPAIDDPGLTTPLAKDPNTVFKANFDGVTRYYFFPGYEEEYQGGTLTKTVKYYFVNGQRVAERSSTTGLRYYHQDHLSSSVVITDASGNLILRTNYDPYGSDAYSQGSASARYKYTDQEKDGSGLYYYGARYYDPVLGRFISPDPVLDGLNRYAYCYNNPIIYTDPTGNFSLIPVLTWSISSSGVQIGYNFSFFGFGLRIGFGNDSASIGVYAEIGPRAGGNGATFQVGYDYYVNQHQGSCSWGFNVSYHSAAYEKNYDFDWQKLDNEMLAMIPIYYEYDYNYSYFDYYPVGGVGCGFGPGVMTTAGTMWWLCAIDGPLPIGDIAYGLLVAGSAVIEYEPIFASFFEAGGDAAQLNGDSGNSSNNNFDKEPGKNPLNTTKNFNEACRKLGIDRNSASNALHAAKRAAGRGGADNVLFNYETGDIISPETGESIGSLFY